MRCWWHHGGRLNAWFGLPCFYVLTRLPVRKVLADTYFVEPSAGALDFVPNRTKLSSFVAGPFKDVRRSHRYNERCSKFSFSKALRNIIAKSPPALPEAEARLSIIDKINEFINTRITLAAEEIAKNAITKIREGDVILTYGRFVYRCVKLEEVHPETYVRSWACNSERDI